MKKIAANAQDSGHVYQAARDMFVNMEPPSRGVMVRTLPQDTASFTGRESELQVLEIAVQNIGSKIIAINAIDGMAGVGKTAFAVHAAHSLAKHFPDGQLFVNLHAHTPGVQPSQPDYVLSSLLSAAGVDPQHIPANLEAKSSMWRDRLSGKRMLIVLDDALNYPQLEPLLPGAANCLVLITSRGRLTDLTSSHGAESLSIDILTREQAVELFIRVGNRSADASQLQHIERIVQLCGYLPLAICLVAARLVHHPAWTIAELAAELEAAQDRLSALSGQAMSVEAAFQLSYQQLPQARRRFFRQLSLTPGVDIDIYAAAALNDISLASARSHLDALYNDHLLEETARERYRMHDLVHEFGRSLAAKDTVASRSRAAERLFNYYEYVAAAAARQLSRRRNSTLRLNVESPSSGIPDVGSSGKALTWMDSEQANLLACAKYCAEKKYDARLVRFAAALNDFLVQAGQWEQAINMNSATEEASERLGDSFSHAAALANLGWLTYLVGDLMRAEETLEQARSEFQVIGDTIHEAESLVNIGTVHWLVGAYSEATEVLNRARNLFKRAGDRIGDADAQSILGAVRRETAEYDAAVEALENALSTYRDLSSELGEADALTSLASTRRFMGQYKQAKFLLETALPKYRTLGDRHGEAVALVYLGAVNQGTGDFEGARFAVESALTINRAIGSRHGEAEVLVRLSAISRLTKNWQEAENFALSGLSVYRAIGSRLGEADALNELGAALSGLESYQEASQVLNDAFTIYIEVGNRHGQAEVLNHLGAVMLTLDDVDAAARCHLDAREAAEAVGSPHEIGRSLEGLARCSLRSGDELAAIAGFRKAISLYEQVEAAEAEKLSTELAALLKP